MSPTAPEQGCTGFVLLSLPFLSASFCFFVRLGVCVTSRCLPQVCVHAHICVCVHVPVLMSVNEVCVCMHVCLHMRICSLSVCLLCSSTSSVLQEPRLLRMGRRCLGEAQVCPFLAWNWEELWQDLHPGCSWGRLLAAWSFTVISQPLGFLGHELLQASPSLFPGKLFRAGHSSLSPLSDQKDTVMLGAQSHLL